MIRSSIMLAVLCSLSHVAVQAADTTDQRINIQADSMTMQIDSGNSIYEGNVRFERQGIVLSGDLIEVEQADTGSMKVRVVGSPARYQQTSANDQTKARSRRMHFDADRNVLTMRQDARLEHDSQVIESDHIEYDTSRKVLLAGGKKADDNKRVNIILNQRSEQP